MGVQVTRDLFRRYDPLDFDPEKVQKLAEKHGIRPHFCNQKWRDDRRGWGSLDPMEVTDPRFEDTYDCLMNKPRDPKRRVRDGYYRQGDQVLSFQKLEDYEIAQMRRDYLSRRRTRAMREGNPVRAELSGAPSSEFIETPEPYLRHTDSKGEDRIGPDPGRPVRGFTIPPGESRVPTMGASEPAPRPSRKTKTRPGTTRKRSPRRSKT